MSGPASTRDAGSEGEVTLKSEATGESRTHGPGQGWFADKGAPVRWTVTTDRFGKTCLAVA